MTSLGPAPALAALPRPRTARAPAKINLTLAVLGRRPDGYHELHSIFARLALADEVGVAPAPGGEDRLATHPPGRREVAGDLLLRAATALRAWVGRPLPALEFGLRKRVPVAAGLGGGSSDAAVALRLAAAAWQLEIPEAELRAIGAGLGSDVPFFLAGCPLALVSGRGESVRCLKTRRPRWDGPAVLLVCTPGKTSTAAVFTAHDQGRRVPNGPAVAATERLAAALEAGSEPSAVLALAPELREANDLWPAAAACMPHLPPLREAVETLLGRPVLLSGAGPTLYALYPSRTVAEQARRRVAGAIADRAIPQPPAGRARLIVTAIDGS